VAQCSPNAACEQEPCDDERGDHDADRLRKNPLGVYVNAISWSKELGQ